MEENILSYAKRNLKHRVIQMCYFVVRQAFILGVDSVQNIILFYSSLLLEIFLGKWSNISIFLS